MHLLGSFRPRPVRVYRTFTELIGLATLPRLLISNNHLRQLAGSEIVTLELVQEFVDRGWTVDVYTNLFLPPMAEEFQELIRSGRVRVARDPYEIFRLDDYDLIWIHHSCIPPSVIEDMTSEFGTPVVWNHMSGLTHIELPILNDVENSITDLVSAVSHETFEKLDTYDLDLRNKMVLANPAPTAFCEHAPRRTSDQLRRLALVSNHVPDELRAAADLLRSDGLSVEIIGQQGVPRRLTPDLLVGYDAVVTIGKTVQYALVLGVPVYEYDHFGGAGWITELNLEKELYANFSGRLTNRRLTADELRADILSGWQDAQADAMSHLTGRRERFNLSAHVERLLSSGPVTNPARKQLSRSQAARWLAHAEQHRGLFRTLEHVKDQLDAVNRATEPTSTTRVGSVGVVMLLTGPDRTFAAAVASVRQQTLSPDHVRVLADERLDRTLWSSLGDSQHVTESRLGQVGLDEGRVAALNRAISQMDTEYVAVMDGSVLWHPRYLEHAVSTLKRERGAVAASAPFNRAPTGVTRDHLRLGHPEAVLSSESSDEVLTRGHLSAREILSDGVASVETLVFRRQAALDIGLLDPALEPAHGTEFALRLVLTGHLAVIPTRYALLTALQMSPTALSGTSQQIVLGLLRNAQEGPRSAAALGVLLSQDNNTVDVSPLEQELRRLRADLSGRLDKLERMVKKRRDVAKGDEAKTPRLERGKRGISRSVGRND